MDSTFTHVEAWFVTGSQHLYGEDALRQVESDSRKIAEALSSSEQIPVRIVVKPVLTTPDAIRALCREADNTPACIGLITWMHTFSPAKMWISGLAALSKPFVHLHTQYNKEIPWGQIDMDFMNLNQAAHGGREFGFIGTRLRIERKVIVGYWQDPQVQAELATWIRAAVGLHETRALRVARFGDNMREVAVTEGDKVEAQIQFGYSVNGYGIGDLVERVISVGDSAVSKLIEEYEDSYELSEDLEKNGANRSSLEDAARIELGMRGFLEDGGFTAFTTTFENLHGLAQLPGLAVQRLMADGYGFGAEGDWKTAALVRVMKIMAGGLSGGTSFMEDYTYHFGDDRMLVLGAHMLEVCPSIGVGRSRLEIHPLSIGNKSDPVRLVFNVDTGPGLNATIIDLGNRFRMIVNEVEVTTPERDLPKLPVARAVWAPMPDLRTAAASWIHAGGAHHTGFTKALSTDHMRDYAQMLGIELIVIDSKTEVNELRKELRWNEAYYTLKQRR
jgi:L-arabinose isomerase